MSIVSGYALSFKTLIALPRLIIARIHASSSKARSFTFSKMITVYQVIIVARVCACARVCPTASRDKTASEARRGRERETHTHTHTHTYTYTERHAYRGRIFSNRRFGGIRFAGLPLYSRDSSIFYSQINVSP